MLLYHGSNQVVRDPKILPQQRKLDFGGGFYLTSNREQAARWARNVILRRTTGKAVVSVYEFDIATATSAGLRLLRFPSPNGRWLDFVVTNRCGEFSAANKAFDLVIGPVANDATLPVIDDYVSGKYTRQEAIRRLLPQKLTDQYAFLTPRSLEFLEFSESGDA